LSAEQLKIPVLSPLAAVRYLTLVLTYRCNLRCVYCYNGDPSGSDMTPEVMEGAYKLLQNGREPFHVQLTGGEPTLAMDLVERAAALAERLRKETGRPGTVAIQTNATLLDKDTLELFKKWNLELGVSIDGPPQVNEITRGETRALLKGLELISESSLSFNATTVVTRENCPSLAQLPLFLSHYSGARAVGLDLLVRKGRGVQASPPGAEELETEAARLKGNLALVNRLRKTPLLLREQEALKKAASREPRFFCGAHRGKSLAVTPDGRLYPCGQAACEEDYSFGTVFAPRPPEKDFSGLFLSGPRCAGCGLQGKCPGECPSRLLVNSFAPQLICSLYRGLAFG
jgi:uncharacterized protein